MNPTLFDEPRARATDPTTSDLQRMHQDEWLAALRAAERQGNGPGSMFTEPRCALGRGCALFLGAKKYDGYGYVEVQEWLGISGPMAYEIWYSNDDGASFADIADWFKAERDAHDGNLMAWNRGVAVWAATREPKRTTE